jgi:hypothetical protein
VKQLESTDSISCTLRGFRATQASQSLDFLEKSGINSQQAARLGFARQEAVKGPEDHGAAIREMMAVTIAGNGLSL